VTPQATFRHPSLTLQVSVALPFRPGDLQRRISFFLQYDKDLQKLLTDNGCLIVSTKTLDLPSALVVLCESRLEKQAAP
jgi:hypothetical protein